MQSVQRILVLLASCLLFVFVGVILNGALHKLTTFSHVGKHVVYGVPYNVTDDRNRLGACQDYVNPSCVKLTSELLFFFGG
ncbi:hypothetical protein WN71_002195 [Streptomyces mangrovisoli]|uniref:Uncharacterized protein n=1 Tax=Streptomyces mangrovisoli TaxID=1428628 RepID=A0A1J4P4L2_9ACTN|nr:hypothetical protein WN71_002195 [Streptomyces mangrovisoli]